MARSLPLKKIFPSSQSPPEVNWWPETLPSPTRDLQQGAWGPRAVSHPSCPAVKWGEMNFRHPAAPGDGGHEG